MTMWPKLPPKAIKTVILFLILHDKMNCPDFRNKSEKEPKTMTPNGKV